MADEPEDPPAGSETEERGSAQITDEHKGADQSREARLARLMPYRFKPGVSGNPGGKPKHVTSAYEELLEKQITPYMARALKLPKEFVGFTFREALAYGTAGAGARGVVEAAREITDRLEGKIESSVKIGAGRDIDEMLLRLWEKKMGAHRATIETTALPPAAGELEEGENGGESEGTDEG